MKHWTVGLAALAMCGLVPSGATATVLTESLPEFAGPFHSYWYGFPQAVHIADFGLLIPAGEEIVSATISGEWGNTIPEDPTTAHHGLYLDGLLVANTYTAAKNPYLFYNVPWSFSFTDFSVLEDGMASFDAMQTDVGRVRLRGVTLSIESVIPEPASVIVWTLLSLFWLEVYRRRKARTDLVAGTPAHSEPAGRRPWPAGTTEAILEIIERGRGG